MVRDNIANMEPWHKQNFRRWKKEKEVEEKVDFKGGHKGKNITESFIHVRQLFFVALYHSSCMAKIIDYQIVQS